MSETIITKRLRPTKKEQDGRIKAFIKASVNPRATQTYAWDPALSIELNHKLAANKFAERWWCRKNIDDQRIMEILPNGDYAHVLPTKLHGPDDES